MGLNFRKSITIFPGVRLNLSKSGVSTSFGVKGMRQSVSTTGKAVTTLGIPGTGVYYTKQTNVKKIAGGIKEGLLFKKGEIIKNKIVIINGRAVIILKINLLVFLFQLDESNQTQTY